MVAVRIENRAQLIYLLTEAAELEHEILCCYLFASFSMKDDVAEGVTVAQLERIEEWRDLLRGIVVQEMIHFAAACNLLTAIGGAPQLRRPNLPTASRAYPPRFQLRLMPFSPEAVDQFVSLEQPEAIWEAEQIGEFRATAVPLDRLSDIFSSERNYSTVGELYRGIQDGFSYLAQKLGEAELFVGPAGAQTAQEYFQLPGLIAVHDLPSALEAINVIVEQGEGASEEAEDSHYKRFLRIQQEYREERERDPAFEPARPVVTSPHAMLPADLAPDAEVALIDNPIAIDLCNLFDGCYELMIQVLGRLFAHGDEQPETLAAYADIGVSLMFDAIDPLGREITRIPAGPGHPGMNAGPGFRLSRSGGVPSHAGSARTVFRERIVELQRYCRFLQMEPGAPQVLASLSAALEGYASKLT
ncbi:MAG: ferritin-like protein [Dehalococcoidia bacterium]